MTADKETAILDAMLDLVAERGFHGTPVSQVAKRSGVSAGIIYHYFDSKDALIHELYRRIKMDYGRALLAGDPLSLPWPDNLTCVWLNAFRFYVEHPRETLYLEQYENSPYYDPAHFTNLDENMGQLAAMIQTEFAAGTVQELPFPVLYELTLGVALGLAKRLIAGVVVMDASELEHVAEACCRAIAK
ncbi:MAG: TetR/AcrR family transcriptional regulator [Anaerolineae bacterium]